MAAEHLIGRTIADEITRLRLERAKRRIVETDTPVKDVAIDAGFRNADHFYKVFTRIENIPPLPILRGKAAGISAEGLKL